MTIRVLFPLTLVSQEKDFLFVYIQEGNSKLLPSFLYRNIFLDSNICVKKEKEADSEVGIIQVFKNIQNVPPPPLNWKMSQFYTGCLNEE